MQKEKQFSIGEIAKLTGVTIRTLQYYDNIGLVPLEKEKTNGRRYYRKSDLTRLQQVLFYKSMGLPIKEIKKLLVEAVTREELTSVLQKQRDIFYHKLNDIKSNISFIEASLASLEENKSFPLENLVQLIISLNKDTIFEYKNIQYEKNIQKTFMKHYDDNETILEVYWDWKSLILEAVSYILNGVEPESEQGQVFAKKWIEMIMRITKGNEKLLQAHKTSYKNREQWPEEDRRLMEFADGFIDKATKVYLSSSREKDLEGQK